MDDRAKRVGTRFGAALTPGREGCYSTCMRLVVALLLALVIAPLAAPIARAVAVQGEDHSCCPQRPAQETSTAPCQYLAPLGCCQQTLVPASASSDAPVARVLALAPALPRPVLALSLAPLAAPWRGEHGPPQAPFLRAIVLQL